MSEINTQRSYTNTTTAYDAINSTHTAHDSTPTTSAPLATKQIAINALGNSSPQTAETQTTTSQSAVPLPSLNAHQVQRDAANANNASRIALIPNTIRHEIFQALSADHLSSSDIKALYAQAEKADYTYTTADLQFADRALMAKIHMQIAQTGQLSLEQQQQLYQNLETIATSTQEQEVSDALTRIQSLPISAEDYKLICQLADSKQALMGKIAQAEAICTQSSCTQAERNLVQECKREFTTDIAHNPSEASFGKASLNTRANELTAPPLNFSEHYPCLTNPHDIALFKDCITKLENHQDNYTFDRINRDYGSQGQNPIGQALRIYAQEHLTAAKAQLQTLIESAHNSQPPMSYNDFVNRLNNLCAQYQTQVGSAASQELREQAAPTLNELCTQYLDQLSAQSATFRELRQNCDDASAITLLQAAGNDVTQLEQIASTYQGGVSAFIQDFVSGNFVDNNFAQKLMQPVIDNYVDAHQALQQLNSSTYSPEQKQTVLQNNAQAFEARERNLNFIKSLAQLQPQNPQIQSALKAADGRVLLSNFIGEFRNHGIAVDPNNLDALMEIGKQYFTQHPKELQFLNSCDLIFMHALQELYESDPSKAPAVTTTGDASGATNADNELSFYRALGLDDNTALGFAKLDLSQYVSTSQLKEINNAIAHSNAATVFNPQAFFNYLLDVVEPDKQKMRAAINYLLQNTLGLKQPLIGTQFAQGIKQLCSDYIAQNLPELSHSAADIEAAALVKLKAATIKLDNCLEPNTQKLLLSKLGELNKQYVTQFNQALQDYQTNPISKATLIKLYDIATAHITTGESENVPNLILQSIFARNAGDLSSSQLKLLNITKDEAEALVALGTANTTGTATATTTAGTTDPQQLLSKVQTALLSFNGSHDTLAYRALAYSYLQAQAHLRGTTINDLADNNGIGLTAADITSLQEQFACSALTRLQAVNNLNLPTSSLFQAKNNYDILAKSAEQANKVPSKLSEAEAQAAIDNFISQQQLFSDEVIGQAEAVLKLKNRKDEYAKTGDAIERIFKKTLVHPDNKAQEQNTPLGRASQQFKAAYASFIELATLEKQQQTIANSVSAAYQLEPQQAASNRALIDIAVNQLALEQRLDSKEQLLKAIYAEGNFNRFAINDQAPYTSALIKSLEDIGYDHQKAVIYVREYLADKSFLDSVQDLRQKDLQRTIDFFSQNLNPQGRDHVSRKAYANAISDAYKDTVRSFVAGEGMCFSKTRGAELKLKAGEIDLKIGAEAGAEFAFKKTDDNQTVVILSQKYLAELGISVELNDTFSVEASAQGEGNKAVEFSFNNADAAVDFFARLVTATLTDADKKRFDEVSTSNGVNISASVSGSPPFAGELNY